MGVHHTAEPGGADAELDTTFALEAAAASRVDDSPSVALASSSDAALTHADRRQDIELKRRYATWLLWVLVGQLAVADVVFVAYAHVGERWTLSTPVVNSWLGATLIEIVGIVYVVTQYLFPRRDPSG